MKKSLMIIIAILMFPVSAMCAPFLQCDPQATVTHYKITGDPYWTAPVPAQADGSIKSDVSSIAVGVHNINVAACITDAVWGEECSSTTPFSFVRPGAPTIPKGFGLSP